MTDDRAALKKQLESATGERIAALEAVEPESGKGRAAETDTGRDKDRSSDRAVSREQTSGREMERARAPKSVDRGMGL